MFSSPEKNLAQFNVDPGMSVADFGSGAGFYTFALANMTGPSGHVFAIDVQKDLLQKIKSGAMSIGLQNIDTIWTDLDKPNSSTLGAKTIDRAVVVNTLFQIEKKEIFLKEVFRVLKPNGRMVLIDWVDSYGGLGPHKNDVVLPDVARTLAEFVGFEMERSISVGDHHYGMIFRKRSDLKNQ